jgi:multidrug efflux pump subunit AcrB
MAPTFVSSLKGITIVETIVRYIVRNRSFTLLFLLIILVAGWIKLPEIRISQYPVVKLPTLMINILLPGASSNEIEQRVVNVIEDKLQNTRNLDIFETYIYNSYASIIIKYDYGVDIDDEYVDINSKINNIKSDLPDKAEVTVLKQSPVDLIVSFVLGVTSETASPRDIKQVAEALTQKLRQLKSIEDVKDIQPEEEIRIDLDLARIEAARLEVSVIEKAIKGNNQYLPTGVFNVGDKALTVLAFGSGYTSLEAIRDTLIINKNGKALAVRDIATVRRQQEQNAVVASVDGKPAVLVTMKLSETANIFDTRGLLKDLVEEIEKPEGVEIVWLFDAEVGVAHKLDELSSNILAGIAILAVVLLFSVGLRSALIIAAMLPSALFLSVVGLSFTEYGVQEISLAGFIIALGLIVDNGIVVTENAYKLNHYGGHSHEEAAIMGTSSVIMPLFSSTATTALAFAPLYLLTSTTGLFLHSMVAVIWLCLAASLAAAIIISSVMLARFGTENKLPFTPSPPSFLIALMPFRDKIYRKVLSYFIIHPFVLMILITGMLVATGYVASKLSVIIFPDSDEPYFTVSIEAPMDRNEQYLQRVTEQVQAIVVDRESVELCSSVTGTSFPRVNTGIPRVPSRRNNAQIFCSVDFRDAEQMQSLVRKINSDLESFEADATIDAATFAVGSKGGVSDVEVKLTGPTIQQVRDLAVDLEQHLKDANIEGISAIENEAESRYFALSIDFKERRANALGVDRSSVDKVLVMITHGKEIDKYRDGGGEEYPIVLRAEADSTDPLNVFDRIFVTSRTGAKIPLSQVVEISFKGDEFDIKHAMFKPQVSIDFDVALGHSVTQLTEDVIAAVNEFDLPKGFSVEYDGKMAERTKSFGGMGKYVGIIGLIVLAIFVFQFGSIIQPLIICAAIPLSFIGGFLLLYLLDQPISFLAFIGFTSLMGIVINNSILLVDEGNQLRDQHPDMAIAEVAINAGTNRFMPILLTSITSIVGLLPLAIGDSMFKALAIVVVGGLSTSTFLTLICLPVLYAYTTRKSSKIVLVTHNWDGHSSLGENPEAFKS